METDSTKSLLSTAGFRVRTPQTADQKELYAALPNNKIEDAKVKGKVFYVFKDEKAGVAYVGGKPEYRRYQQLCMQQHVAQAPEDQMNYNLAFRWLSPTIEHAVESANAPRAVVGIVIAVIVLLPETWAAVRAARADRLQSSMNLAIGSALACIGLTVPVVVLASIAFGLPLVLGLEPKDIGLLALTFLTSAFTLGTGRTYVMQGAVHLVIFAAFLFFAFVP